ncbi:hypothetical protein RJ639_013834 [Escallonia herrerae]|uniref:Uncharacterized protein n=1 Tax=Escallonia herrerae TaxID=1293975 RepID=A0AA89AM35_9ASTE|nr:hypothetical protein RJ639_013834 [Escallonia herrerae]
MRKQRFREALSKFQRLRSSRQYTSRVHVADICGALHASTHRPSPRKFYNIVDDDPASRIEVFKFAQNLVEKKWPGQVKQSTTPDIVESSLSEGTLRGEKRVSNARMKRELGLRLLYPSYRAGLQSVIDCIDKPLMYNPSTSGHAT